MMERSVVGIKETLDRLRIVIGDGYNVGLRVKSRDERRVNKANKAA